MRFQVVHKLMSYLLAVAAVATLLTTGTVPAPTVVLLVTAGTLSWFVEPGTRLGRLLDRAGPVFNVLALAFFAVSLYEVVQSFPEPDLSPILNLVLFLLVYKLFHRRANRDYLQLYVLSFLTVLAAAWLAQSVIFVVGFAAYVVLATWTMILFHLRHEIEDNYLVKHLPESAEKVTAARVLNSRRVVGRSFFVATGAVSLSVLLGASLVFLSIPRIGLGFLSGAVRRRMNIVGFSDEVKLGQHGVISRDNDAVVLRAQLPHLAEIARDDAREQVISTLYWRGTVYDRYDNGQWLRSENRAVRTRLSDFSAGDGARLRIVDPGADGPRTLRQAREWLEGAERQVIQIVGLSFPVAFALDRPVAFEMVAPAVGSFVTTDFHGRYSGEVKLVPVRFTPAGYVPMAEFHGGQYVAYSRPPRLEPREEELDPAVRDVYLSVPDGLAPRVRELALRITEGRTAPMAKVQAITEWLQQTHTYTLDLRRDPRIADPLEDFLFNQSAGHCEYFASAAALLLRLAGVPTRYVNGFLGGEWNDIGKHVTVRDNRAHSWVEAHIGPFGWMRVDATPVGAREVRMGRLRQVFDSVELFWSRWVLQYDASRQIDLARRIGRQLGVERGRRASPGFRPDRRMIAAVIALAVVVVIARRLRRGRWLSGGPAGGRGGRGGPPIFRLYRKALDRLAARGFPRQTAETPAEYAARMAAAQVPGADILDRLTRHYAAARYGDRAVPDEVIAELEPAVEEVGRAKAA